MAARGWTLLWLAACGCGRAIIADDAGTTGTSHAFATQGDDDVEVDGGPPISVTITVSSSESAETSGATTSSTTASTAADTTTTGLPSESSGSNEATTMELDFEPIVLGVASAGIGPGEVSAFAELESFLGEYDEEVCNVMIRCGDNTAPAIEDPILWVNGAPVDGAANIQLGDRVGLLFAFADAECNVACGTTQESMQLPGQSDGGSGSAHTNFPCDTASTNVMLGVDLYEVEDAGDYTVSIGLRDVCDEVGSAMITMPIGR